MDDDRTSSDDPDEVGSASDSGVLRAIASTVGANDSSSDISAASSDTETSPSDLPRGATIGPYVILGRLSEGLTGIVYAAFDPRLDKKIALKLVEVTADTDELAATRRAALVRTADRASHIDHPCVVRIHDVGTVGTSVYVAMEFVDGIDLRQWMEARDDPFPWPEVLRVFREAGRGLAAAHGAGSVHGDFTPGRVLLGKQGRICVLDFGLAMPLQDTSGPKLSVSDLRSALPPPTLGSDDSLLELPSAPELTGTPGYMAPELHAGLEADPKADQFAYCAAFYEALYGEAPFKGETLSTLAVEAMAHNVRAAPADADVPSWLRDVLVRGLSPRRKDRFGSMEALLRELDHDPAGQRRRWVAGVTTLATVGAAVGGIAFLLHSETDRCEADEALLDGTWDPATRRTLEEAFVATERPHAAKSWSSVQASMDEWAQQWLEYRTLACRLMRADGDELLMNRRNACLDRVLEPVAAFGRVYSSATPAMVDRAQRVATRLARPSDCVSADMHEYTAPPDETAASTHRLRRAIDEAWISLLAGDPDTARAQALEIRSRLESSTDVPLRLRTLLVAGLAAVELDRAQARELLHEAAGLAAANGLRLPLAEAWIALARAEEPTTQLRWLEYAEAVLDELGDDRLRARLFMARGAAAHRQGHDRDALSAYHRALALLRPRNARATALRSDVQLQLGFLTAAREEWPSAERYLQQVVDGRAHLFGPEHPELIEPLYTLGGVHASLGDPDAAIAALDHALRIADATAGHEPEVATLRLAMGTLEAERDQPRAAALHFESASRVLGGLQDEARLALALRGLGRARVAHSGGARAIDPLERADRLQAQLDSAPSERAPTWEALGRALRESRPAAAKSFLERARAVYAAEPSDPEAVERIQTWLTELDDPGQADDDAPR